MLFTIATACPGEGLRAPGSQEARRVEKRSKNWCDGLRENCPIVRYE
jgi:hypothetical protein